MNPMNASVFRSTSACVEIKEQDGVVVTATVVSEVERNLEDQERSPGGLLEPRQPPGASFPTVENRGKEGENHEHDVPQYLTHQSDYYTPFRTHGVPM